MNLIVSSLPIAVIKPHVGMISTNLKNLSRLNTGHSASFTSHLLVLRICSNFSAVSHISVQYFVKGVDLPRNTLALDELSSGIRQTCTCRHYILESNQELESHIK